MPRSLVISALCGLALLLVPAAVRAGRPAADTLGMGGLSTDETTATAATAAAAAARADWATCPTEPALALVLSAAVCKQGTGTRLTILLSTGFSVAAGEIEVALLFQGQSIDQRIDLCSAVLRCPLLAGRDTLRFTITAPNEPEVRGGGMEGWRVGGSACLGQGGDARRRCGCAGPLIHATPAPRAQPPIPTLGPGGSGEGHPALWKDALLFAAAHRPPRPWRNTASGREGNRSGGPGGGAASRSGPAGLRRGNHG